MKIFLLAVFFSLMLCPSARAVEDTTTRTHEPVVVTASRIPEKAKNVTAAMTVIPQEELAKGQYQDVGSMLRNYGVQVDSYGPSQNANRIRLRGISTSFNGTDDQGVQVLLDGRSIGTDNISMIPIANVERVEILRGPGAVQYGSSGMGGVINVITRRGTDTPKASIEGGFGSFSQWLGQGWFAGKVGNFDFAAGGLYTGAENYNIGGGNLYDNTAFGHKRGYNVNLGYTFFEQHRLGLSYTALDAANMGSPGYYPTAIDSWGTNNHNTYSDRFNGSLDALYEGGVKDLGLSWKARYYTGASTYYNEERDGPKDNAYDFANRYQGSQGQLTWKYGILTLTAGVDWLRKDVEIQPYQWESKGQTSTSNAVGEFLLAKLALFDEKLIISGGLRNDDFYYEMQNKETHQNNVSPSVGIAWHATDWLTLKGNYGEGFRAPAPLEVLGFKGNGSTYLSNSNLKPEKTYGWDAGFDIEWQALKLGATYFQTQYEDKIISVSLPTWESQYRNAPDTIWLKGIEGYASFDIGQALDWPVMLRPYINVTHMTERKFYDGETALNVPDWTLGYGLNFAYPEIGFSADLRCTYYGNQFETDYNDRSPHYNEVVKTGNKTVVDIFASQQIYSNDKIGKFSVQANVRNLFDEKYAFVKDYPMPGRSFYVGLKWEF